MDTSRQRNQSIERLLRQSLQTPRHAGATLTCLDAEALAAWVDGGLSGAALEMARSHVADCARCQSLVGALARTNAVVAQPAPERAARRWLPWLVPLTAAAAAVALWVAVPRDLSAPLAPAMRARDVQEQTAETTQQPQTLDDKAQAPVAVKAPPPPPLDDKTQTPAAANGEPATPAASGTVERQAPAPELRKDADRLETDRLESQEVVSAPAASPPSAPPAAERPFAARSAGLIGVRGTQIVSPDPSVRWRIDRSIVERSTNGGASWDAVPTGIVGELTAGAAPSTSVCWVVGRGGVVLLTIDGRSWRRVPFPEMTDLSAVRATDAATASVSTADGRIFSTSDSGVTWDRR